MRKFLIPLVFLSFTVNAQPKDQCPIPNECYTDKLTYEIIAPDGTVIDRTVYERLVGLSFTEVMALKYMRMLRTVEGGARNFSDILQHGTANNAIKKSLKP